MLEEANLRRRAATCCQLATLSVHEGIITIVLSRSGSTASHTPDKGNPCDGLSELQPDGPHVGRRRSSLRVRGRGSERRQK